MDYGFHSIPDRAGSGRKILKSGTPSPLVPTASFADRRPLESARCSASESPIGRFAFVGSRSRKSEQAPETAASRHRALFLSRTTQHPAAATRRLNGYNAWAVDAGFAGEDSALPVETRGGEMA